MSLYKSLFAGLAIIILALVGLNFVAFALDTNTPSNGSVIDKTVVKKGANYTINETINGDLFCFGETVTITGTINGDVFCAAQDIIFSGVINGSARFAAENVNILGTVSGNVSAAASSLKLENSTTVESDMHVAAQDIVLAGSVARDFSAIAKKVTISGSVGRDVSIKNANLTVAEGATIGGTIHNNSPNAAKIDSTSLTNKVNNYTTNKTKFIDIVKNFLIGYAFWFVSLMLISFVMLWLFPSPLVNSVKNANDKPIATLAIGLITIFVVPVALIIIALTVVGIPLAILLGLIYVLIIFMSGPFFAFFVGSKFLPEQKLWVKMLLGSSLVLISYSLPVIGFAMAVIVTVFGGGMFTSLLIKRLPHVKQVKPAKV